MELIAGVRAFIAANKIAFIAGGIALLGAILLTIYLVGRHDGKTGEVAGEQKRENKVQTQIGTANDTAAASRVTDAVRNEKQEKDLSDALKATTDPDRQRAIRGCVILREQGRDTSGIPACNGSSG